MLWAVACIKNIKAGSEDSGNGSFPYRRVSLSDESEADFDTFEDTFGRAFNIDHPGNVIRNDYLQFLPIAEQELALAFMSLYETRRDVTFGELLLVNLYELRDVTPLALSHQEHSYFHND